MLQIFSKWKQITDFLVEKDGMSKWSGCWCWLVESIWVIPTWSSLEKNTENPQVATVRFASKGPVWSKIHGQFQQGSFPITQSWESKGTHLFKGHLFQTCKKSMLQPTVDVVETSEEAGRTFSEGGGSYLGRFSFWRRGWNTCYPFGGWSNKQQMEGDFEGFAEEKIQ